MNLININLLICLVECVPNEIEDINLKTLNMIKGMIQGHFPNISHVSGDVNLMVGNLTQERNGIIISVRSV